VRDDAPLVSFDRPVGGVSILGPAADEQSVGTPADQNNRRTARSLIRKTREVGSAALSVPGSTIVLHGPNSGGGDP
jgi:hypothetical protein